MEQENPGSAVKAKQGRDATSGQPHGAEAPEVAAAASNVVISAQAGGPEVISRTTLDRSATLLPLARRHRWGTPRAVVGGSIHLDGSHGVGAG
jgi:hypothetical protein